MDERERSTGGEAPPDGLRRLADLVARLRGPAGCPWDREQGLSDLRAYLLEEAHEVAAALDSGDWDDLRGELGDLLFQAAFIARLAEEAGRFTVEDAIAGVAAKMIARHPHVFGGAEVTSAQEVRQAWERRKAGEKAPGSSLLSGLAATLPALTAAQRMTQKAAGVGFDWSGPQPVLTKLEEELAELRAALAATERPEGTAEEELGDLLFTIANLARHLEVDPEGALARANAKFRRRFARMEEILRGRGRGLAEASAEELEALWEEAKREERSGC